MRLTVVAVVFSLLVGPLAMGPTPIALGAGADTSLVVAALRVLEQSYYKPVDPITLLNSAIVGLRRATSLGPNALPDIPVGLPEVQAVSTFQQRFAKAVQSRKMSERDLAYLATREMLASLRDAQTVYLDPAQFEELKKQSSGSAAYAGIGASTTSRNDAAGVGWIFIDDVYPESPAQAAGLRRFDKMLEVDGKSLRNVTLIDAIQLIRGPAGSTAVLVIQRGSQKLTVSVVRAPIRVVPRAELIRPGLAYLRIYSFSDGTGEQARRALRALAAHGSIRGVVLDLRGNRGGSYREIVSVAGVFLPSETVIAQLIQHGQASPVKATGESLFPSVPLVVLSDGTTAAGSETLMTGLRSTHRATIIGEKSAGAGLADVRVPLPAGGMQYTFEEVVGPHSEPIHGVGVTPDSTVALTEADMERGVDTQLDAALKVFGG